MENFIFAISCIYFFCELLISSSKLKAKYSANIQPHIHCYLNSNFYIETEIRYGYQSINKGNVSNTVYGLNGLRKSWYEH